MKLIYLLPVTLILGLQLQAAPVRSAFSIAAIAAAADPNTAGAIAALRALPANTAADKLNVGVKIAKVYAKAGNTNAALASLPGLVASLGGINSNVIVASTIAHLYKTLGDTNSAKATLDAISGSARTSGAFRLHWALITDIGAASFVTNRTVDSKTRLGAASVMERKHLREGRPLEALEYSAAKVTESQDPKYLVAYVRKLVSSGAVPDDVAAEIRAGLLRSRIYKVSEDHWKLVRLYPVAADPKVRVAFFEQLIANVDPQDDNIQFIAWLRKAVLCGGSL